MAVYIAAHKAFDPVDDRTYIPLQVGAAGGANLPYTKDNTGENISDKNPHFCELTGLYWIRHNTQDDYKGLVHYRRYFMQSGRPLAEDSIRRLLADSDILLPPREVLRESAWKEFCLHSGHERDLVLLREAVEKIDAAYLPSFDRVMAGNRLHLYNMLIARREIFDAYCDWLFAVLFELENHVDMTGYTPYEQRLFGFLSERLLNVWVAHNQLTVRTVKVKNTQQTAKQALRLFARRQKNRLLFALKK